MLEKTLKFGILYGNWKYSSEIKNNSEEEEEDVQNDEYVPLPINKMKNTTKESQLISRGIQTNISSTFFYSLISSGMKFENRRAKKNKKTKFENNTNGNLNNNYK